MNKFSFLLFLIFLAPFHTNAQVQSVYSKVQVPIEGEWTIQRLADLGIGIDHVHGNENHSFDFIVDETELAILKNAMVPFELLLPDMKAEYKRQLALPENNLAAMDCGLEHFDKGSMGSYHTYEEVIHHIHLMQQEFPALVSVNEIGKSIEDRIVYAVKISDNVATDESSEEGLAYFDALTHAREPIGLETNLYYMWWLLENYGTDPEATYLVDHREMYFVPVVNPDGYVFNQSTDPDGGGYWRKNRRDNGDGSFGVDLNRNYSFDWGEPWGSSSNPASEIYHGEAPFSEPEARNVRDLLALINPAVAFSCHTYGDVFITPQHYEPGLPERSVYYDFASEFIPETYRAYGTGQDLINYSSAGTTRSYLHTEGIYGYTPEFGHQFWEPASSICDRVTEAFVTLKYMTWVSGDYAVLSNYELLNKEQLWKGDEMEVMIEVRNKGLRTTIQEVSVSASSPSVKVTAIVDQVSLNNLAPRTKQTMAQALKFELVGAFTPGEEIPIDITITQDGMITSEKRLLFIAGIQEELFLENGEGDLEHWDLSSPEWGLTSMDAFGGEQSIADSPEGNYTYGAQDIWMALKEPIDLSLAENPFLEFKAKWSFQGQFDYLQVQISTNKGGTWEPLTGEYTEVLFGGITAYSNNKHWIEERIDLKPYIGETEVLFRFLLHTNNEVHSDGFYFDDFRVMNYSEGIAVSTSNPLLENQSFLFPNPNTGEAQLKITRQEPGEALLVLSDLAGRTLETRTLSLPKGLHIEVLQFASNGFYLLEVRMENGSKLFRVLTLE